MKTRKTLYDEDRRDFLKGACVGVVVAALAAAGPAWSGTETGTAFTSPIDNPVKEKIKRDEAAFGVMLDFGSPELVELYGYLGFEWVMIMAEHRPIDHREYTELVRACNVTGLVSVVMVPDNSVTAIKAYLDAGVLGILAPHIKTAAEARAIVDAVKFPPLGKRGGGPAVRAANYGVTQTPPEYFRHANEATFVFILVEDVEGIDNLDEILAVNGIDAVQIGHGDLSMSMGFPGEINHPEVRKVVDKAEAKVAAAGKGIMAVVRDAAGARKAVDGGARLVMVPDRAFIGGAARSFLAGAK